MMNLSMQERQEVMMAIPAFQRAVYNKFIDRRRKEQRRQMARQMGRDAFMF